MRIKGHESIAKRSTKLMAPKMLRGDVRRVIMADYNRIDLPERFKLLYPVVES